MKRREPLRVAVRLDEETSRIVRGWREHLDGQRSGTKTSVSDTIRNLIAMAGRLPDVKKTLA
jgi:hypothetical protein